MQTRPKSVLVAKRDLFRLFHKRLSAEGHQLHCEIEDGRDTRATAEGHADGYDEIVSWLSEQLIDIYNQLNS